jgi:hypothetical protein
MPDKNSPAKFHRAAQQHFYSMADNLCGKRKALKNQNYKGFMKPPQQRSVESLEGGKA